MTPNPELHTHIEHLASFTRVESERVGFAATPSASHAAFMAVAALATGADLEALVAHEHPVVRGYVAQHVLAHHPAHVHALRPLFADEASVETMSGCVCHVTTVAEVVLSGAGHAIETGEVQDLLLAVAGDPTLEAMRGRALTRVAPKRPVEARAIAIAILDAEPEPNLEAEAICALGSAHAVDEIARVLRAARSEHEAIREAAAAALIDLGPHATPDATPIVRELLGDAGANTRGLAARAWPALAGADAAALLPLLDDEHSYVRDQATLALVRFGDDASLAAVARVLAVSDGGEDALAALVELRGPAVLALMRKLLRSQDFNVRVRAAEYLGREGDHASIPELRRSLAPSASIHDKQAAIAALTALGDRESWETFAKLLEDTNAHARNAAAIALVHLSVVEALPALRRAVENDTSWGKANLAHSLARLEELARN